MASGGAVDVMAGCVRNSNGRSATGQYVPDEAWAVQVPRVRKHMQHNPRVTDTDRPGDPHGNDTGAQAQIRTFLIADVRGYTLFTQERGDEAAAKLAAKFADIAREIVEARG